MAISPFPARIAVGCRVAIGLSGRLHAQGGMVAGSPYLGQIRPGPSSANTSWPGSGPWLTTTWRRQSSVNTPGDVVSAQRRSWC